MTTDLWLSFDVEASGPVAGIHGMLSLGIVAYHGETLSTLKEVARYYEKFDVTKAPTPYGAGPTVWDMDTATWWHHQDRREAYLELSKDVKNPGVATLGLVSWLRELRASHGDAQLVWAAWPATFDFQFVSYYCEWFANGAWRRLNKDNVMQRVSAFDMASMAMALLNIKSYHDVSSSKMPPEWLSVNEHEHVAIDDALYQGKIMCGLLEMAEERGLVWW